MMSSLVSLKTRLNSITSTQKVVKALELVASSKIKKARTKAKSVDFFYKVILDSIHQMDGYRQFDKIKKEHELGQELIIVITSDLGLCGPYNNNVIKRYMKEIKNISKPKTFVLGLKGYNKLKFEGIEPDKKILNYTSRDEYELTMELVEYIFPLWKANKISNLKIIYTDYINPLNQVVKVSNMLDLEKQDIKMDKEILIEGEENDIFEKLFDQYIFSTIYSTILKSLASEHSYRRNSTEAASNNSKELMGKLEIELNRVRQSVITQEISEIIGGSEASKKE